MVMNSLVVFEDSRAESLLPLTTWRGVFELRLGRETLIDRLAQRLALPVAGVWTRESHAAVAAERCSVPANRPLAAGQVLVNGRWFVRDEAKLEPAPCVGRIGQEAAYVACDDKLAAKLNATIVRDPAAWQAALAGVPERPADGVLLRHPWDFITHLTEALQSDWRPHEARLETALDPRVVVTRPEQVHVGARCTVHPTTVLDASAGPIYISHDVQLGAYSVLEGPAYIGPGTRVNPHTWLHGGCSIGPVCKIGGEIDACIFQSYSNKQHAGFLGHSFVASWVNLGAGTCNSDLKNTYGTVRAPDPAGGSAGEVDTGRLLYGAAIGDFVKTAIGTRLPTGAAVGFAAMLAGSAFAPKQVPDFAWFTDDGMARGDPEKLLETARRMMSRRNVVMTAAECELFLSRAAS